MPQCRGFGGRVMLFSGLWRQSGGGDGGRRRGRGEEVNVAARGVGPVRCAQVIAALAHGQSAAQAN